jgi:hypothetical protein
MNWWIDSSLSVLAVFDGSGWYFHVKNWHFITSKTFWHFTLSMFKKVQWSGIVLSKLHMKKPTVNIWIFLIKTLPNNGKKCQFSLKISKPPSYMPLSKLLSPRDAAPPPAKNHQTKSSFATLRFLICFLMINKLFFCVFHIFEGILCQTSLVFDAI